MLRKMSAVSGARSYPRPLSLPSLELPFIVHRFSPSTRTYAFQPRDGHFPHVVRTNMCPFKTQDRCRRVTVHTHGERSASNGKAEPALQSAEPQFVKDSTPSRSLRPPPLVRAVTDRIYSAMCCILIWTYVCRRRKRRLEAKG